MTIWYLMTIGGQQPPHKADSWVVDQMRGVC
jgi:hypothetical protein